MLETCLNVDINDGNCLLALAQQFPNEFSESCSFRMECVNSLSVNGIEMGYLMAPDRMFTVAAIGLDEQFD